MPMDFTRQIPQHFTPHLNAPKLFYLIETEFGHVSLNHVTLFATQAVPFSIESSALDVS